MKKHIRLIFSLSLLAFAFAPAFLMAQHYRGMPPIPQELVIDESFDSPSYASWNTWTHSEAQISTEGGKYILTASYNSELEHWLDLPLSASEDYELDLSIALRNNGSALSNSYGFIFGMTNDGTRLAFTMGSEGQYSVQELDSRGDAFVWQYDHAPELIPYRFQQFVVRKVGDQVSFMVDGNHIYDWHYEGISGARVGMMLSKGASVMVDHLRVMKLAGPAIPDRAPTDILLTDPNVVWENGFGHFSTDMKSLQLHGKITEREDWMALWINEQFVPIKVDGSFSSDLTLLTGSNAIGIKLLLPNGTQLKRQLNVQYFEPLPVPKPLPQVSIGEEYQGGTAALSGTGRNFLVLIGVNQYDYWNDLHNAVKDCEDVAKTLVDHYQFEANYVIRLYNDEASRVGILETMEWLQDELLAEDNLLLYYAGHGYYDEQDKLGYWVPNDARMEKVPDYIPNSTIHDYLGTIDCMHTLLIADACFSGSLLSSTRGNYNVQQRSRWVFASGGEYERVFDGAPGENSPFAEEMISYLMDNKYRSFFASEMIEAVSSEVTDRVKQHPIGSPLLNVGDRGGVFPFVPKTSFH
ncbi:MAG: caspase family protein [Bacteroidia bacterium]|nr:caspase family protein [Bacteroidia bacterium]